MAVEERPTKLRKFEHPTLGEEHVGLDNHVSKKLPSQQRIVGAQGQHANHLKPRDADATETNEADSDESHSPVSQDCEEPVNPAEHPASALPLSKNALKKIRNKERWDASRDARKLKRKQKIAEKRIRKRAAKQQAQKPVAATAAEDNDSYKRAEDLLDKPGRHRHTRLPITFVIDCGFDSLMTEREIISLGSQLTRSYSDNHKAPFQAHMFVSSWSGQLKERFDTILDKHHENWRGVTFMEEDFVEAAQRAKELMKGKFGGKLAGAFATENTNKVGVASGSELVAQRSPKGNEAGKELDTTAEQPQPPVMVSEEEEHLKAEKPIPARENDAEKPDKPERPAPSTKDDAEKQQNPALAIGNDVEKQESGNAIELEFSTDENAKESDETAASGAVQDANFEAQKEGETIYLTSDSPYTLDHLKPYSTYIVGGLVDKNRHKGICYKTACDRGIKTAKLPIGEFIEMQSRFILATNHVVEIMVRWLECGDWGTSFIKVMPKRKGGKLKAAHEIQQDMQSGELDAEDGDIASSRPP